MQKGNLYQRMVGNAALALRTICSRRTGSTGVWSDWNSTLMPLHRGKLLALLILVAPGKLQSQRLMPQLQVVVGQSAKGKSEPPAAVVANSCAFPGIPAQQFLEVVDASYALPAALAADGMIRVALKISPHCPILARDLLQRAFEQADAVKPETGYSLAGGGGATDSRIRFAGHGNSLRVDRLSLQSRVVLALVRLDAKRAIRLFHQIPLPRPPAAGCSNAFAPDVSIYYEALEKVVWALRAGKPRNDAERQTPFMLLRDAVEATTSPVELFPLAAVIVTANLEDEELSSLLNVLAVNIANFPIDDRSLSAHEWSGGAVGSTDEGIEKLVTLLRNHRVSSFLLVHSYHDYLDRSIMGLHCDDNLRGGAKALAADVKSLNEWLAKFGSGIDPISVPESSPIIEPGPNPGVFWHSPKTKQLLIDAQHLNFDEKWRRYTDADRTRPEWRDRVQHMLDDMEDWKATDEQDPAGYFHQRCILLSRLLNQLPPGPLYGRVVSAWIATFEESPLQWDKPAEWYYEVTAFLDSSKRDSKGRIPSDVLSDLKNSSNPRIRAAGVLADFLQ